MFHPLIGSLKDISLEDIISKINELSRKHTQSLRGGNQQMCNQIRAALAMYQEEYQNRMVEISEKAETNKMLRNKVKVEK